MLMAFSLLPEKGTYCMTGGQDKSIKLWNPFRPSADANKAGGEPFPYLEGQLPSPSLDALPPVLPPFFPSLLLSLPPSFFPSFLPSFFLIPTLTPSLPANHFRRSHARPDLHGPPRLRNPRCGDNHRQCPVRLVRGRHRLLPVGRGYGSGRKEIQWTRAHDQQRGVQRGGYRP